MKQKKTHIELTQDEKIQLGRHFDHKICRLVKEKYKTEKIFFLTTGIKDRHYWKLVSGGNPGLQTIFLFAKALNVDQKDLLDFDITKKILRCKDFGGREGYLKFVASQKKDKE